MSGERRIDVIEFVTIVRAIGADPIRLLRDLMAGKPPAKPRRIGEIAHPPRIQPPAITS